MTTPATPPIGLKDVATELAIGSVGLSLSDSRVRTLAGVPSGPINLHELLDKSAAMTASIGGDQGASDASGTHLFTVSVTVTGGTAPYTYQWHMPSQGGTTGSASFSGSTTGSSVNVLLTETTPLDTYTCSIYCAVTDSLSNTVNSNTINLSYTLT